MLPSSMTGSDIYWSMVILSIVFSWQAFETDGGESREAGVFSFRNAVLFSSREASLFSSITKIIANLT